MKRKRSPKKPRAQGPKSKEDQGKGPAAERKDRVLQARVSPSLHNNLVAQARRLRVPVSNLVRNILEDSTRMVEAFMSVGAPGSRTFVICEDCKCKI